MVEKQILPAFAGASLFLACLAVAAPVEAASFVTYVSGRGTDSGACATPATACRSFQFAINQTNPGGEVKALDAANYGPIAITKSISIEGVDGAGIVKPSGDAVKIEIGASDKVRLDNLVIEGSGGGHNGIVFNTGGFLTISRCTIRQFVKAGLRLQPTAGAPAFLISEATLSNNGEVGLLVGPQAGAKTKGTVERSVIDGNIGDGLRLEGSGVVGSSIVALADSKVANNDRGVVVIGAVLELARTLVTGNNFGLFLKGRVYTAGDNFVHGNVADVKGDEIVKAGTI